MYMLSPVWEPVDDDAEAPEEIISIIISSSSTGRNRSPRQVKPKYELF